MSTINNNIRYSSYVICFLILSISFISCGEKFLEIKQDKSQAVPGTIDDLQAMLDNATTVMNGASSHELGIIGSDEYYVSNEQLEGLHERYAYQRNGYIWAQDVYEGNPCRDWNLAYHRILYANLVLDGLKKIEPGPTEKDAWNNVKGSALFFRAFNFYQLVQLFCKPYNGQSSATDLGIPLRLESDVTLKTPRATLEESYERITLDLIKAAELLPAKAIVRQRPSKPAAYALLARAFLQMGDYAKAGKYASRCLQLTDDLIDLNEINLETRYTFPAEINQNPEILFHCSIFNMPITSERRINIDTVLLKSYAANDLRKDAYFYDHADGRIIFNGSYTGNALLFTGLAVNEIYLIQAECYARLAKTQQAMTVLNQLLRHRYHNSSFTPVTAADAATALDLIIQERRKELVLRGLRWQDLRRLNKEEHFSTTIARELSGRRYELPPGDPRWVWPVPDNVIDLGGIEQNIR